LLKEVKNNPATQNIPVVLITARAGEESRIEGYSIGADDYLVKPFSAKELIARINSQITLSKKRSAVEKQLHGLFEQAPSAILILKGYDLVLELANERALEIMGRTKEESIGKKFMDVLPELEAQGYLQMMRMVYESGRRFIAEEAPVTFLRDNVREDIFVKYVFQPLRDEDDHITGIMIVGDDVTAQVLARKKIEESEKELQRIFKQAPVAINIYEGEDFIIRLSNRQQLNKWGLTEEEVLGKPVFDVIPQLRGQGIEEILTNILKTGESVSLTEKFSTTMRQGKTAEIYVDAHFEPWKDESGQIKGIISIISDVTDRVLARIKLEEANRQLKLAKDQLEITFKNIPSGIYHFDKNGSIKYLNKQGAALMGYNTSAEVMENPDFGKLSEHLQNEFVLYDEYGKLLPVEKGSVYCAIITGKPPNLWQNL
jgi:PAS domain S-box-containing protein